MAKTYLEKNSLHFGLDYMVIFWTFLHEEMFHSLNFENSDYWELEDFTFNKVRVPKYLYGITFQYKNYKVFSYVKWDTSLDIPSHNAVTIYWVAFKIMSIDEIRYFIEWYFNLRHLKRFDICIDVEDSIEHVLKRFKPLKQKGWKIFWKGWDIETQYIWNPSRKINKRSVIRIYNKNADLKGSQKEALYMDYLEKDNVTRIELEIRWQLALNVMYYQLFEEDVLKWLMKNYFRRHTKIFDNFSKEKISLYRKPSEKSRTEAHQIYYEKMYIRTFIWYARRIKKMWICPVRLLIWRNNLLEETKDFLWKGRVEKIAEEESHFIHKYLGRWKI